MKHFKDLFSILCLLFITSAFVACDDDNDEYATDDETILSVPQDDLIFTYEGEAKTINVTASENTLWLQSLLEMKHGPMYPQQIIQ